MQDRGYPVFTVGGKPFFPYGAAFFYERTPRAQWRKTLSAYQRLGINTIDLYLIWNWHEPAEHVRDFTGTTNPRRDLRGLLRLTHRFGFKLILRPGPVIRNEWRNGGYPAWLLERPGYDMPLHDVLDGRYPATATLQNAHADAAAAEWLANGTHRRYAAAWLRDVLHATAPYANDVIAIALDDDQGAYLDNDTWPAPHWHTYIDWLRSVVASAVGPRVPLFINTYDMKVPAASPAWAWGNWYQSSAYAIGAHDLAQLDFATGLLQTQPHLPVMQAEFQAGWLQGADEAHPRPADPSNTTLALNELLRDGAHGIVNFPVQDTIDPAGWEAPWANWSYAWDAALTVDLQRSQRYAPTAAFGAQIARYGPLLARTHPAADAAIVWPPSLFPPSSLTNHDFAAFADATIAMQRECQARDLTCPLVDLAYADSATLQRYSAIVMPIVISDRLRTAVRPAMRRRLEALQRSGRLVASLGRLQPAVAGAPDTTLLLGDNGSYAFLDSVNPSDAARTIGPLHLTLDRRAILVPKFTVAPRGAKLVAIDHNRVIPSEADERSALTATPPPFGDRNATVIANATLRVAFAPNAGARIAELTAPGFTNAATSIGLLRDAVDPEPTPSSRDYIAAFTHPLPAGTFNRPYRCTADAGGALTCEYHAPDLSGGATFQRTLRLDPRTNELVVTERYVAAAAGAHLVSISGFAFSRGDTLIAPAHASFVGILHGRRLATLRWHAGDVARVILRRTRGAELVTLLCARSPVEFRLGLRHAADAPEALRLLQTNPR